MDKAALVKIQKSFEAKEKLGRKAWSHKRKSTGRNWTKEKLRKS